MFPPNNLLLIFLIGIWWDKFFRVLIPFFFLLFLIFILIENKQSMKSLCKLLSRGQYDMWKAECQKIVPVLGSGKFVTTPLVGDDGQPIDPSLVKIKTSDKKVVQWLQLLHQIGKYMILHKYSIIFFRRTPMRALRALVNKLKEVNLYKNGCNYYIHKSQNLYLQDKFSFYGILNRCP